jgi:hypothetical protein
MPRDGSNIYHRPPGTDAVPDTTIESTKYNSNVADVEQDLNMPRPIVAGGTGASDAHTALINLHGEESAQFVTNYDTFPFVDGSFGSNPGATSAPLPTETWAGNCCGAFSLSPVLTARCVSNASLPTYIRQKVAGSWLAWVAQAGSSTDLDTRYVNVAGDNMSGALGVPSIELGSLSVAGWAVLDLHSSGTAVDYDVRITSQGGSATPGTGLMVVYSNGFTSQADITTWRTATPAQGYVFFGNSATKYLGYDGTNFNLVGGALAAPGFYSAAGYCSVGGTITAGGAGTTGAYYFGSSGTKYLNYDGTNFNLVGGLLNTAGITAANDITTMRGAGSGTGYYYFGNTGVKYLGYDGASFNLAGGLLIVNNGIMSNTGANTGSYYFGGAGTKYLNFDGTNFNFSGAANSGVKITPSGSYLTVYGNALGVSYIGGGSQYGIECRPTIDGTTAVAFTNSGGGLIGNIGAGASSVSFNTTSSAELKEDLKSFDAGNIIDNTEVYNFKWKASDERAYGVIAQQAIEVYPTAVTHHKLPVTAEGKEAGADDEFWGVDYSKYVPVLLQELKALRARVAALEGK